MIVAPQGIQRPPQCGASDLDHTGFDHIGMGTDLQCLCHMLFHNQYGKFLLGIDRLENLVDDGGGVAYGLLVEQKPLEH